VRAELPTGTVTFLFSDIEGSTRLLQELGDGYAEALAEHRRALRESWKRHEGVEVDTQGDAFFVAFARASDAVAAAADAQGALAEGPMRVRIGLHTGEPLQGDEGYVGLDVHRAARIAAAGHGGQVLLSQAVVDLAEVEVRDLGLHRLKDLSAPERIFQLGTEDFPPLNTLHRTNLPIPATPFLGREAERAEVADLLGRTRVLTLTGPGGTGKTRLALQAVAEAAERYPDGVFWVPLAPLRDPELVLDAAARALGARGELSEYIGHRSLLLLFDNFEHVLEAAGGLGLLLADCPRLQLVVTSRELLRLPGEQAYPVPPLEPDDGAELFLARARATRPDFVSSPAVAELCTRLDNLPLAIELAAARVRVLAPAQLLERLSQRLDLLTGARGVDPRQQTLRATIEWSYELLDEGERKLFARLAAFYGSWSLEAAEQICEADIDTLESLIDKSLVLVRKENRFWMLESIREYAAGLLAASGEGGELRRRHADYFLHFAETVEPELRGGRQEEWLERLELDLPNLRAALEWSTSSGDGFGLRLATALGELWFKHGHLREGRRWQEEFVDDPAADSKARAKALVGLAVLATLIGEWREAEHRAEEGLRLADQLDEPALSAWARTARGRTLIAAGDHEQARQLFREAEALGMGEDEVETVAVARFNLGYDSLSGGDYDEARQWFEATLSGLMADSEGYWIARTLAALASVALHQSRTEEAIEFLRRSLDVSCRTGDRDNMAWAIQLLGVAYARDRHLVAARLLGAADALREDLGGTLEGVELALHEGALAELRDTLGPEALSASWAAGRNAPPELIVDEALAV
jgi:predicted ATPase/class 3 adenylate cyclase/Tfp pilus assembly protein PilF